MLLFYYSSGVVLDGGTSCVGVYIPEIKPLSSFCGIFRKKDEVTGDSDLQQMWEMLCTSMFV